MTKKKLSKKSTGSTKKIEQVEKQSDLRLERNLVLGVLLVIAVLFAGFLVYVSNDSPLVKDALSLYTSSDNIKVNSNIDPTALHSAGSCPNYGAVEKSAYLDTYMVEAGDTVASIAKTALRDRSRANELITLNKDKYPDLSLDAPSLQVGWNLYLPIADYDGASSGDLQAVDGEVVEFSMSSIIVRTMPIGGPELTLYPNPRTLFIGNSTYNPGDCVRAIYDEGNNNKLIKIISQ